MAVEPGEYKWENGEFVRIGDAEEVRLYKGGADYKGEFVTKYDPIHSSSEALYFSDDVEVALAYAHGEADEGQEGYLHIVRMRPETIAHLPEEDRWSAESRAECRDAHKKSVEHGFDLVYDPNGDIGPEILLKNTGIAKIEAIYEIDAENKRADRVYAGDDFDETLDRRVGGVFSSIDTKHENEEIIKQYRQIGRTNGMDLTPEFDDDGQIVSISPMVNMDNKKWSVDDTDQNELKNPTTDTVERVWSAIDMPSPDVLLENEYNKISGKLGVEIYPEIDDRNNVTKLTFIKDGDVLLLPAHKVEFYNDHGLRNPNIDIIKFALRDSVVSKQTNIDAVIDAVNEYKRRREERNSGIDRRVVNDGGAVNLRATPPRHGRGGRNFQKF